MRGFLQQLRKRVKPKLARIIPRITTVSRVIKMRVDHNCFNEPSAVSTYKVLYFRMHGLILETSIYYRQSQPGYIIIHLE